MLRCQVLNTWTTPGRIRAFDAGKGKIKERLVLGEQIDWGKLTKLDIHVAGVYPWCRTAASGTSPFRPINLSLEH